MAVIDQTFARKTGGVLDRIADFALAPSVFHLPVALGVALLAGGRGFAGQAARVAGQTRIVALEIGIFADADLILDGIIVVDVADLASACTIAPEAVLDAGLALVV